MKSGRTEEFAVAGDGGAHRAGQPSPLPDAPVGAGRSPATPATQWRGALPWVGIAVVLVLTAVLLAPAQPPEVSPWGQVADVTSAPEPAWSSQPSEGAVRTALLAGDVLITVTTGQVQGIGLGDGATLWSRTLDRPRCTSNGENLVCTEPGSRVLDLAPETGSIAREQAIEQVQLAAREAGDLYALTGGADAQLQRISDGEPVWSVPVDDTDRWPPMGGDLTVIAGHVLTNRATVVPTYGGAAGSALDAESGSPVDTDGDGVTVRQVADGVWTSATSRTAALYVRGEPEPQPIEPAAAVIGYDDQWEAAQQLRTGEDGGIGIFDSHTDSWLWQSGGPERPLVRLDGVLIGLDYATGPHVTARDTQSGELLWELEHTVAECPCLADEHTLVFSTAEVTVSEDGFGIGRPQLVAIDARTGETVWQLETPGDWSRLLTDGEHLIAVTPPNVHAWDLG